MTSPHPAPDPSTLDFTTWEFRAPIELRSMGATLNYTVVYLPAALADAMPSDAGPNVRVHAVVNEIDVEAAFQLGHGRWSLMVSKALQRAIGARLGDMVDVRFSLAPAQAVDVPDALRTALQAGSVAARTFAGLSAGKQRALSHRVRSAKTAPTRARRVDEVVAALAGGPAAVAAFFGRKMQPAASPVKSTRKQATSKQATSKQATSKQATSKKATSKQATSKKATSKEATAKKATAKKATAKKRR